VTSGKATTYLSVDPLTWGVDMSEVKITNAWGLLRSPWNTLSKPYLTRCNQTFGYYSAYSGSPRCGEFYHAISKESEFFSFVKYAAANCHGSIHTMIGGVFGSNWHKWAEEHDWQSQLAEAASLQGFGISKDMWRDEDLDCPDSCTSDADCACSCNFDVDELSYEEVVAYLKDYAANLQFDSNSGEDICRSALKLFCGQDSEQKDVYLGDSMDSGATADPSFWPTHPNVDRLFQWRVINGISGMDTWLAEDDSENTFYWGAGKADRCWGHYPSDVMVWQNLFINDEANADHFYTVGELFTRMDPHLGYLPYVYDNFKWSHCADEGYPIDLIGNSTAGDDGYSWTGSG